MGATKKRPVGRPFLLDEIIRPADETREAVTRKDQIVLWIRQGNPIKAVSAASGIAESTLEDWLRTGTRVLARRETARANGQKLDDLTYIEESCAELSERSIVAEGEFEIRTLQLVDRVARGAIPKITTIEKHARVGDGDESRLVLTERTTRTTHTLPDARLALQRLAFRHPDRYARTRLELYDGDAPSVEFDLSEDDAARIALESLGSLRPIDVESTIVEDD